MITVTSANALKDYNRFPGRHVEIKTGPAFVLISIVLRTHSMIHFHSDKEFLGLDKFLVKYSSKSH